MSRRLTFIAAASILVAGCSLFHPAGKPPRSAAEPAAERRVTVQFHLAGDTADEARVAMQAPGGMIYMEAAPALTRADVAAARAYHGEGGSFVEIVFNFEGRYALAEMTRKHGGERLAILIDGELHSAPRISGEIADGRAYLSNLSRESAEAVAASLGG